MKYLLIVFFILLFFSSLSGLFAQDEIDEEKIVYYQMEPYDDSLFIKIQEEVFIDPPDPKAEIIVDLRDPNNQTISIKGTLYPFLAFTPETRAKITTYPFKLNLIDEVDYGSVFTRVIKKISLSNIVNKPRLNQIIPTTAYINPYLQLFGGERFGIPIKNDIGISFGFGTPYSLPLETNFSEANFHILGFYAGGFNKISEIFRPDFNKNPLYTSSGYQFGYVIPLGNFFEISYQKVVTEADTNDLNSSINDSGDVPKFMKGHYFNWELRYPLRILGSSRGKIYIARYQDELHAGLSGRELSLAGSIFDLRIDALFDSDERYEQYSLEVMVQRVAASWGFSAFAIGPSAVFGNARTGNFSLTSLFLNVRLKIGTSL